MATIPQRELRNDVGQVLRRAEAGERLVITVGGRPVAELGPVRSGERAATPEDLAAVFDHAPVDGSWLEEVLAERAAERAGDRDPPA